MPAIHSPLLPSSPISYKLSTHSRLRRARVADPDQQLERFMAELLATLPTAARGVLAPSFAADPSGLQFRQVQLDGVGLIQGDDAHRHPAIGIV